MAHVLVIDDEPVYLSYLARKLEHDGHAVDVAIDGDEARQRFAECRPDLVVVDWRLRSQEDGVAVFQSLRAQAPDLEGLLITGYPPEEVRGALVATRLHGPLEKPFPLDELSACVDRILSQPRGAQY